MLFKVIQTNKNFLFCLLAFMIWRMDIIEENKKYNAEFLSSDTLYNYFHVFKKYTKDEGPEKLSEFVLQDSNLKKRPLNVSLI